MSIEMPNPVLLTVASSFVGFSHNGQKNPLLMSKVNFFTAKVDFFAKVKCSLRMAIFHDFETHFRV